MEPVDLSTTYKTRIRQFAACTSDGYTFNALIDKLKSRDNHIHFGSSTANRVFVDLKKAFFTFMGWLDDCRYKYSSLGKSCKILFIAHNGFAYDFPIFIANMLRYNICLQVLIDKHIYFADSLELCKSKSIKYKTNKLNLSVLHKHYFPKVKFIAHNAMHDASALCRLFESPSCELSKYKHLFVKYKASIFINRYHSNKKKFFNSNRSVAKKEFENRFRGHGFEVSYYRTAITSLLNKNIYYCDLVECLFEKGSSQLQARLHNYVGISQEKSKKITKVVSANSKNLMPVSQQSQSSNYEEEEEEEENEINYFNNTNDFEILPKSQSYDSIELSSENEEYDRNTYKPQENRIVVKSQYFS